MDSRTILATNIKYYRYKYNLSQEKLAEICNCSLVYINQVENEDRNVSIDILKNQWSPALMHFDNIIISVQSLLNDPNPNDFLNQEAAKLYIENKKKYEERVVEYTIKFANLQRFKNDLNEFIEY